MGRSFVQVSVVALVLAACGDPRREENDSKNPFGAGDDGTSDAMDDGGSTSGPLDPPTPDDTGDPSAPGDDTAATDEGSGGSTAAVADSGDEGTTGAAPGSSSGDGGSDGSSSGEPATDTYNDGTVDVAVSLQSMWPQGQCNDVVVTNVSAADVTWEVTLDLPGTIDQLWNAEVQEMPGMGVFTGVDFNATLSPGAQASFGFCVLY